MISGKLGEQVRIMYDLQKRGEDWMNEEIGGLFLQICRGRLERNTSKLLDCLSSLPEEEIWKRPNSHSNSVGNLILHLCGNARQWIISGIGGPNRADHRVDPLACS